MHQGGAENWWHRNHLEGWRFPKMPIKRELIYRIFRAAYPHGAFVDDNLKMVELRDKEEVWQNLKAEIDTARADLGLLIFSTHETHGMSPKDIAAFRNYYTLVLDDAEGSLFRSQNGRYLEFRCMEELLVRYKMNYRNMWKLQSFSPSFVIPPAGGYRYAADALEVKAGSDLHFLTVNYSKLGGDVRFPVP
ncbi:uncharacterized protein F4817DRAFT_309398 [Daldinia loculata]|uniref:uncharacterized protein n=1 Tax=Daldinia loculata TaxID=103429 RepID=UPI0020C52391|nr:uncharacterized protein F4817DRAFT_309398 [Daldinia loculata]KAI1642155.1 hypothetical protein F4817DRAFT_309398 [Daldinia loculata]